MAVRPTAALLLLAPVVSAYAPLGLLAAQVEQKRREVERLRALPEAREDGPWALRLAYPASAAHYGLARAVVERRGRRPAVLVDLKRASPGARLGASEAVDPTLDVPAAVRRARQLGAAGALVAVDQPLYGGSLRDLSEAAAACAPASEPPLPLVAKDLFVDPLQLARAAHAGATAVLLIAAAVLPDLPALLDTCTLLGLEALVEVHTPDELHVASECGAPLLLVNERDRATGKLVPGQAAAMASHLPGDATLALACGGLARLDQARALRRAGYDGLVLGRAWTDERSAEALLAQLEGEFDDAPARLVTVPTVIGASEPPPEQLPEEIPSE